MPKIYFQKALFKYPNLNFESLIILLIGFVCKRDSNGALFYPSATEGGGKKSVNVEPDPQGFAQKN